MKVARVLLAVAGGALLVALWRSGAEPAAASGSAAPAPVVAERPAASRATEPGRPREQPPQPPLSTRGGAPALFDPKGEGSLRGYLVAVVRANKELGLDEAELEKLVAIFIEFIRVQCEIEARLPAKTYFDGVTLTVELPVYPAEGRALRDAFHAALRREFPHGRADRIDDHLGSTFDNYFRGFGAMAQKTTVHVWPEDRGKFWIAWSATAVGDLTPSGVPQHVGRLMSTTGTAILTREEVAAGQFRNLHGPMKAAFGK